MIDPAAKAEMVRTLMALEFFYAILPGVYGVLYVLGHILRRPWIRWAGYAFGVGQLIVTALMLRTGYLDPFWARLVVVIALAYFVLPPGLWRLAEAIHKANAVEQS